MVDGTVARKDAPVRPKGNLIMFQEMNPKIIALLKMGPLTPMELFRRMGLRTISDSDEMRKTLSEMELQDKIERIFIGENLYTWRIK